MQQKIKEVFTDSFVQQSTYAQELYKNVKKQAKKLDVIAKIEEKIAEGFKINADQ